MPIQTFDLIVIGTGSAGVTVAKAVREAGKRVAIIDKLPFGGTCSQRGCDPKKVLAGAAEIIARSNQMQGNGLTGSPTIDWPALIRYKKTFTNPVPQKTADKFADLGIHTFQGATTFLSADTVHVGNDELRADKIVIATGQRPKPLDIPGEDLFTDSTGFMELPELPATIVMIGGGYIAFEFAHIAARAGTKVTILHQGKRPLEDFDADLVRLLVNAMEAIGIRIVLNASVTAVEGQSGNLLVRYHQKGMNHSLSTHLAVHAAGRVANVAELCLAKAGVKVGEKGIVVNAYLQSRTNPAVYACGDVAEKGLPLTPLASVQGQLVAENILHGNRKTFRDKPIATVVFTVPPLASVGLTEQQANEQRKKVTILFQETTDWYSSRRINEPCSAFKFLIDPKNNQILGAHLLGWSSEEAIDVVTLAMKHHIPADELIDTLFAYPTHGADLKSMLSEE